MVAGKIKDMYNAVCEIDKKFYKLSTDELFYNHFLYSHCH